MKTKYVHVAVHDDRVEDVYRSRPQDWPVLFVRQVAPDTEETETRNYRKGAQNEPIPPRGRGWVLVRNLGERSVWHRKSGKQRRTENDTQ